MISSRDVLLFQEKILAWYSLNKRDLPWRKTRDPYSILVSEIMLQQTQVERVIPKFTGWMSAFPDVSSLAKASQRDVLALWSGLGYNRRAMYLHKTAQVIVDEYQGVFPRELQTLQKLPGIGTYTSAAVLCFAYNNQIPVLDTNIKKVITHEFFSGNMPSEEMLFDVAQKILPVGKAYDWNQALMDYSRIILKDKKIPIPKQSRFLSSDRYYRGQVVKLLLKIEKISFSGLWDFFQDMNPVEKERLHTILEKMHKEQLIFYDKKKITLLEVKGE